MNVGSISAGVAKLPFDDSSSNCCVVKVALEALAQAVLAIGVGVMGVTCFSASPIILVGAYFVAIKVAKWAYLALSKKLSKKQHCESMESVGVRSRRYLGAMASPGVSGVVIHEAGHFVAIKALLKEARPRITIRPFKGGATYFDLTGKMTPLGNIFGLNGSLAIIAAAGATATVVSAMGQIALCERIKDSLPAVKDFILSHAISQLATEALYALSALMLKAKSAGHDFQMLWTCVGIHPIVPISLIVLLPTVEWLALRYLLPQWKKTTLSESMTSVSLSPA